MKCQTVTFRGLEAVLCAVRASLRIRSHERGARGGGDVAIRVGMASDPTFFFVSLYVQQVLGCRPFSGGLVLLPFSAGIVSGAALARKAAKVGPRSVA